MALVIRTRVWIVQLVVGFALILAGIIYALTNLHLMPGGGTATGLPTPLLVIAIAANFLFGILLNFGIGEVDLRIASGIALGGIPAVLVAAFLVKSMSLELLRWLVVCVVLYAALVMLKAALSGRRGVIATDDVARVPQ